MSFYTSNAPITYGTNIKNVKNIKNKENIKPVSKFYQICSFQNPHTNKYHVRKFIINSKNEFASIKEYKLSKTQYKKLLEIKKTNEYKCYSTYDLKNISYPNYSDILTLKSNMITDNNDYYGFAPF